VIVRVIQWLSYTGVAFVLASVGLDYADWRWWLAVGSVSVAACANYHEGRMVRVNRINARQLRRTE
jgi:hypothetical protein